MTNISGLIERLLESDSTAIQQATADLQLAYKNPETVPALCELVVSNQPVQIRQYAAVLLRKRLAKLRHWQELPEEQHELIKKGMFEALINEQEKPVRNAIAQLVGVIVRHDPDKNSSMMKELLAFIYARCSSSDIHESEVGAVIFSTMADVAPDQFVPHINFICEMFSAALSATEASAQLASPVVYNIIVGMTYLVPFILGHNAAEMTYQKSVPLVIKSLSAFAEKSDPEQFIRAFDILEAMADYTPKLLSKNLRPLLEFSLSLANAQHLDRAVRNKTVAYIGWMVRLKKKMIIKQKLVVPILTVVFNLMCTETPDPEDEEDDNYFQGGDGSNPMTTATQTLDLLALNVPSDKLIPPLLVMIDPALQNPEPLPRRAAYLSMAVIAEGCSEAIIQKYLEPMLKIIKVGITDPESIVRNAAFFALGQFAEHLQPDISAYAAEIMPILFEFLHQLSLELRANRGSGEPKHISRMFYALETFCENLEDDALVPYLPTLMERLFESLDPHNSSQLRELTISTIGAVASASREKFLPYFPSTISMLQGYLNKTTDADTLLLRPTAIDCLAALARHIGKANFLPLASDTMGYALNLLEEMDDPDLRRAIFNLISALAEVVNEEMASVFPKIIPLVFETVMRSDEVLPEFNDSDPEEAKIEDDDIDIETSDGEDTEHLGGYSVENSYLEAKEEAILALKEFALNTGTAFLPYLEQAYQNVYSVIDNPAEDIRRVAVDAMGGFIVALHKSGNYANVETAIKILIPKIGQIIRDEEEVPVVLSALESYTTMLRELKKDALPTKELRDTVFQCVFDVMMKKAACQFTDTVENDDDAESSEVDEAIVEAAGNILALLGGAMEAETFNDYFGRLYPLYLSKMQNSMKNEEFDNQRAFCYGALAECFEPLDNFCSLYFQKFLPIMTEGLEDEYEMVRQNAVFGLGELVAHAKEQSYGYYPQILNTLSCAISRENVPSVLDNVCGAIARVIVTNPLLVPIAQVLPVFLKHLPLREDFSENAAIFKCLKLLYIQSRDLLHPHIGQIVAVTTHVLHKKEWVTEETKDDAMALLKELKQSYPEQFNTYANSSIDIINFLQSL